MTSLVPSFVVRYILLLVALSTSVTLCAQNFPVRASVTILEASPYLEDYGRDGNLLVVLTLVDNQPSYQGLLRITVQGNGYRAETRDLLSQPPISFNFGQPVILRGADLAPYFDLNNLVTEGIALDNTLGNGGALPDGPITICVEVYDVNRFEEPPVSNPACAVRFVQQHYPPELVNPLGEEMTTQVVNFTWNPRHVPQPANDAYDLDVWEKIPGLTPDQIINSAPPVTPTITTNIPRYVFTNYDGRLAADKTYIWRVRVRDRRNIRTFVNDGYSQPGEFYFGEDPNAPDCPELETFYSTGTTANNAGLVWALTDTLGLTGYDLRYRVAGTESWTATSLPATNLPTTTLPELSAGSNYEAELCATCTDGSTSCLKTTFTTPDQDSECGPLPYPTVVPVSEEAITLSWEGNEAAAGYRLYWSSIVLPPSPPQQQTSPAAPQNRNRGQRISPIRRTPPGTSAPPPSNTISSVMDSLLLSAGTSSTEISGLTAGTDYSFRFCQLCPDGTQTCYEWTIDFNGVDDDCLTSLNFTRPDSTDTTLDLAWTYDPNDISATDSFTFIWQLADGSGPEITATVAYEATPFTITDRIPGQTYTLRVCAECTIAQPTCRDLPPFGGCVSEYLPELVDIADKRALIGWPVDAPPTLPTQARYAMRSFLNWADLPTETFVYFNPDDHLFPGDQLAETRQLYASVVYLGQVRTQCFDTLWSAWSEPVEFSTGCAVVDPLEAVAITDESATILAVARANANYYQYYYRLRADGEEENNWNLIDNVEAPALELTSLLADTVYQVKMRYWCNLGVWSDFTEVLDFRTLPPCGAPEDAAATELFADAAGLSWLMGENALLTTLNYRRVMPSNQQTETQSQAPGPGARNGRSGRRSSRNGGGSSSSPGEWLVVENLMDTTFLDNLEGGARYEFRLQSDCDVNLSEWSEIEGFTLLCSPPSDLTVRDITPFTAQVSIAGLSPTAGSHQYSYRLLGDSAWTAITRATPSTLLEELDDLSTYELRVRTRCSAGQFSVWSDTLQFTTLVDCRVPTNLGVADMTTNSADIRWDVTGTITQWEIRYYDPAAAMMQSAQQQGFAPAMGGETGAGGGSSPTGGAAPNRNGGVLPNSGGGVSPSGGGVAPAGGGLTPSGNSSPATTNSTMSNPAVADALPPDPYANWQTITTTDPSRTFNNLVRNRKYKVVVRAECPTFGWTDFSEVLEFSPLCPQPVIDTATADDIGFEDVTLNWPALNPCMLQYRVELESLQPYPGFSSSLGNMTSPANGNNGQTERGNTRTTNTSNNTSSSSPAPTVYRDMTTTTETTALFEGLRPNTEYRFRIQGYFYKSVFAAGPNGYLTMADGPFGEVTGFSGAGAGEDYVIGEPGWGDYSEWIVFRTDHCAQPYDIVETTLSRSIMELSWTPSNGINEFEVKYKLAEDAGASWAYETVTEPVIVLENLLSNAIYDYQVTEVCQDGETFRPAPQDTFIMKKPSLNNGLYVCGLLTDLDLSNETPLPALLPGDTIMAFDFPVVITEASGGGGTFSGVGEIRIPYFNKAKMTFNFDNIFVNDEYQMVGGYLEATGFGIEVLPPWADSLLNEIIEGLELIEDIITIAQLELLEDLMDLGENANLPPGLQQQIQDVLDCFENAETEAQIEACTTLLDSVALQVDSFLNTIYDGDFQVVFEKDPAQKYGFDARRATEPTDWYQEKTISGESYLVPFKSVLVGGPETVKAIIPEGRIDSVAFSQPSGSSLNFSPNESGTTETIVDFSGQGSNDYFLVAEQIPGETSPPRVVGMTKVVPYPSLPLQVTIVPVGFNPGLNAGTLANQLKDIYGQAVVSPIVNIDPEFNPSGYDGTLDAVGSGLLTNYSPEMRDIIEAYETDRSPNPDVSYLFIVNNFEPTDRAGFMPRGRQFGFIYHSNAGAGAAYARTIAHELGHGAFVLEHTWEANSFQEEGTTDNLMDYGAGTHLYKWQWDLIHDPVSAPILPGDEDGEQVVLYDLGVLEPLRNQDSTLTFLSPGGKAVTIPKTATMVSFNTGDLIPRGGCVTDFKLYAFGTLKAFKFTRDGQTLSYVSCISCNADDFVGYTVAGGGAGSGCGTVYTDSLSGDQLVEKAIIGFPCFTDNKIVVKAGKIPFSVNNSASSGTSYTAAGSLEDFDWLVDEFTGISTDVVIESPNFSPALNGALLSSFLTKVETYADCGNPAAIYVFAHVHQLNANPDYFKNCADDLLANVETDAIAIQGNNTRNYFFLSAITDFNVATWALGFPIFQKAEVEAWEDANMSIYEAIDSLRTTVWSENYWNALDSTSITDAQKLLNDFYAYREDQCVFESLTIQQRVKALKMLNLLSLTESNFFDFRFSPIVFLISPLAGTISPYSEDDEEHLFNAILGSTPADLVQYQAILDHFKGSGGTYSEFYSVANKMLDAIDDTGYARFATILSRMVFATKSVPAVNITPTDHDLIDPGYFPKNLFCDIVGQSDPNELTYVKSFVVGTSGIHHDMEASFSGNKINISADYSKATTVWHGNSAGTEYVDIEDYNIQGNPFDYVALRIEKGLKIITLDTSLYIEENQILLIPYCWAHLIYNKIDDEEIKLGIRLALDIVSIALVPFSGGASLGLRILIAADVAYSLVDGMVMAQDQFDLATSGESDYSPTVHAIWNYTGVVVGAANLTGFISVAALSKIRTIRIQKLFATYKEISESTVASSADVAELLAKARATYDDLIAAPIPPNISQADLDLLNLFKSNFKRELDAAEFYAKFIIKPLGANTPNPATVETVFSHTNRTGDYILMYKNGPNYVKPVGTVTQDIDLVLTPERWLVNGGASSSVTEVGTMHGRKYIANGGGQTTGSLSIHYDPVNALVFVKEAVADVLAGYPSLSPFKTLFETKLWTWSDFSAQFAAYADGLTSGNKALLLNKFDAWVDGTNGLAKFNAFKSDILDQTTGLASHLDGDISKMGTWEIFYDGGGLASVGPARLSRMGTDLVDHPETEVFLRQNLNDNFKYWLNVNNPALDNIQTNLLEWLEDVVLLSPNASMNPKAGVPFTYELKYNGDVIGEVSPTGISYVDNGPIGPGQTLVETSPGGGFGIKCNPCGIGVGACFPEGVLIQTPEGAVEIQNLKPGDDVISFDHESGTKVEGRIRSSIRKEWYRFTRIIADSVNILSTNNHPYYVPILDRYLPADSLRRGMNILALTGALLTVQSVSSMDSTARVYNIDVEDFDNYYAGNEGVLVHNSGLYCWPSGITNPMVDAWSEAQKSKLWNHLTSGNYNQFVNFIDNNSAPMVSKLGAWKILDDAGLDGTISRHLFESSTGAPKVIVNNGDVALTGTVDLTTILPGGTQSISEPFIIVKEGNLYKFRPKYLLASGTTVKFNRTTTRPIIVAKLTSANPSTLNAMELRSMQSSISNHTGSTEADFYFALKNAYLFKSGELLPSSLPAINVWKNHADGFVWTLDHRRLVAYRLAGITNVPVTWANPQDVVGNSWILNQPNQYGQSYKMSTPSSAAGENLDITVWRKNSNDKFVFVGNGASYGNAERYKKTWKLIKQGNGSYIVKDDNGLQLDILTDIPGYIDFSAERIVGNGGSFNLVKEVEKLPPNNAEELSNFIESLSSSDVAKFNSSVSDPNVNHASSWGKLYLPGEPGTLPLANNMATIEALTDQILLNPTKVSDFNTAYAAATNAERVQLLGELEWFFAFKPGYSREGIAAIAHGSRPAPSTYLTAGYITSHLQEFQGNASYLVTGQTYTNYIQGQPLVGRPDGLFISTNAYITQILTQAAGDIAQVEILLGIPAGGWQGQGGIYRIDISNPENFNLRLPSGNEDGANALWLPGGRTSGGVLEAVTDQIPQANITGTQVIN